MKHRRSLFALLFLPLGCAAQTPAPAEPPSSGEVAVIDLVATQPPAPPPKQESPKPAAAPENGEQETPQLGILSVLKSNDGQGGDEDSSGPDGEVKGNMWGSPSGGAFGAGGLGLTGSAGGSGTGQGTIGLGSIGTLSLGAGLGLGSGRGYGFGSGGIGGATANSPKVKAGSVAVSGRLPPEVIQRILRMNFGRFRLCYENGLRAHPALQGRIGIRLVINVDGSVKLAESSGTDLPDKAVVDCVVKAVHSLTFPKPEGGTVTVMYPLVFTPADSAAPAAKPPAPPSPAPATAAPVPPPPAAPAKRP